jgi:uncharacterized protein
MQESEVAALQLAVVWVSFAIAFVLGAVMNRTHFCTMGALSDIVNIGDWTRMRMWLCAIGVAMLGAQLLDWAGVIDLSKSLYTGPRLNWLSYVVGGLMFGFGMVLASGCGAKTLVRVGGGSLKSLVVFVVLGVCAYMTLKGVFGVIKVAVLDSVNAPLANGQDLPRLIGGADAALVKTLQLALGVAISLVLLIFVFSNRDFRRVEPVLGGVGVGLAVIAVWYISGQVGHIAEDPRTLTEAYLGTNSGRPESLSFVAPVAYTLDLLMLWSDTSRVPTIGISSTLGIVAGSATYALVSRKFRWEGFHGAEDTANHLVGGALMGVGGITAIGCTIGQGVTGLSTLALGSMLAFVAIIAGALAAFRYQAWRVERTD